MDAATASALIDEAAKRSGLIWARAVGGDDPPRPLWHVWSEGVAYVLTGGIEQPCPAGLGEPGVQAEVTLRSKATGNRLVAFVAEVTVVMPGSPVWDVIVPTLQSKRLNSPDGEHAPRRWAQECRLLALRPTGTVLETPDAPTTTSHAAPPPATPATTPVPRPWQLFQRGRRRAARRDKAPDRTR